VRAKDTTAIMADTLKARIERFPIDPQENVSRGVGESLPEA
jgi:hypothetical protein